MAGSLVSAKVAFKVAALLLVTGDAPDYVDVFVACNIKQILQHKEYEEQQKLAVASFATSTNQERCGATYSTPYKKNFLKWSLKELTKRDWEIMKDQ